MTDGDRSEGEKLDWEGGGGGFRNSPPALQNVLCVLLLHILILREQLAI